MGKYVELARELHKKGYTCSQAVLCAFMDLLEIDEKTAINISCGFGGGLGKLRETCGAVSGMLMAAGLLYGEGTVDDNKKNTVYYPRVQYLCSRFREMNGSLSCAELLGVNGKQRCRPEGKTCRDMVADAAAILEEYISENPIPGKTENCETDLKGER